MRVAQAAQVIPVIGKSSRTLSDGAALIFAGGFAGTRGRRGSACR
jgi:hypothetical protein